MRAVTLFIFLIASLQAEISPTPTLTARQRLVQEVATLRMAQQVAQLPGQPPPTDPEIAATRKLYDDLIRRYPDEAEPHAAFGDFLHSLEKNQEAFSEWQLALKLDPTRDDILASQADIFLQTGQIVAAADALEKAALIAPARAEHFFGLAHIYTLFRRDLIESRHLTEDELITRGTAYFKKSAELAPDNLGYLQAYAEAFYTQPEPDWAVARAAWESLLQRSEGKFFIHGHLARVNIRLKDKSEAQRHLEFLPEPTYAKMKAALQKQIDQMPVK